MRVMVVMAVKGGNGFAVLVELGGVDLLLAAAGQVHLHPDTLLLPPRKKGKKYIFKINLMIRQEWEVKVVSF